MKLSSISSKPLDILCVIARVMCGLVLVFSGFTKAIGPAAEFAAALGTYQLLPAMALKPLSMIIPWIEIYVGLFLLLGLYTHYAIWLNAALYACFSIFTLSAVLRKLDLTSCGCFGSWIHFTPSQTLLLDIGLFTLALFIILYRHRCTLFSVDVLTANRRA